MKNERMKIILPLVIILGTASASVGASFTRSGLGIALLASTQYFFVKDAGGW